MNTDYTVKNFRIFDPKGCTVDIRPITILTGCNNSGKSSIVKSICLLKNFCEQIENDYGDEKNLKLENYKINFHKRPLDVLGSFNHVLHENSQEDEGHNDFITIELVVDSSMLMQDVLVTLEFGTLSGDDLENGYLHSYTIKTLEGHKIYRAEYEKGYELNFEIVKKSFLSFLYSQRAVAKWQGELAYRQACMCYPSGKDQEGEDFENAIKNLYGDCGYRGVVEMLEWQTSHCSYSWKHGVSGSARALLSDKKIDSSFYSSAQLGVFVYFPFMLQFVNLTKDETLKTIREKVSSISLIPLNYKLINLFLETFESSKENSIHEFVSQKENEILFHNGIQLNLASQAFAFPFSCFNKEISDTIYDESDVPEKMNWEVLILALDALNQVFMGVKESLIEYDEINDCHYYFLENKITEFQKKMIEDILVHILPGNLLYTSTSIVNVKRMYSLEEDNEFVDTLKTYFEAKRLFLTANSEKSYKKNEYIPCTFINKWLPKFGVGHHVKILTHADGNGVTIRIYKNEQDEKGMLIADKGYGIVQLFVILLKIEVAILRNKYNQLRYTYDTSGIGKSLVSALRSYEDLHPITIALEEPENHLHPSYQSRLAELIVDANQNYSIHFIVETHSEYLIRKLQLLVAQSIIDHNRISIQYVNDNDKSSYKQRIENIGIDENGNLINEFGPGFFDESINLATDLFKLKEEGDEK